MCVEQHSVRIRRAATIACVILVTSTTMKPRAALVSVYTHAIAHTQTHSFMRTGLQPQQDLMQLCCGVEKGMQRHLETFGLSR